MGTATTEPYRIEGIDTLLKFAGGISKEKPFPIATAYQCESLKQLLNFYEIGWVPYCLECKQPLVWHYNEDIIFSCPCGKVWKKDGSWKKK